jgi:hypothetical protein
MRGVIIRLIANACVDNSAGPSRRFNWLLLCCIVTVAANIYAAPPNQKEWLACDENADCTSVTVGCYRWAPVNKQHAADMKREGFVPCKKSVDPGPQPIASCVDHMCVNDGYRGRDWGFVGHSEVNRRIDSCLEQAGMKMDWTNKRDQYYSLGDPYWQKIGNDIRQDASATDKRLDEIITSQIPCQEVVAKTKSLMTKSQ